MADSTDVLLTFCEREWSQARQSEDQRATITNMVLLIASAIIGFTVQFGVVREVLPLTILLIVLGVFGAIASEKLYERHQFHFERARVFRNQLMDLHPATQLSNQREEVSVRHAKIFPLLSKLHVHHLWLTLHMGISLAGVLLTVIILIR